MEGKWRYGCWELLSYRLASYGRKIHMLGLCFRQYAPFTRSLNIIHQARHQEFQHSSENYTTLLSSFDLILIDNDDALPSHFATMSQFDQFRNFLQAEE